MHNKRARLAANLSALDAYRVAQAMERDKQLVRLFRIQGLKLKWNCI